MAEKIFMRVDEVAEELGVSVPYAYKLIKRLNEELKATGCITIAGRIDRKFFYVIQEKKESKLQKALDAANKLVSKLTAELKAVKAELLEYKSVLGKLDRAGLERENAELREKVRWYDSIIDAKNLRNLFIRHDHRRHQERQ